MVGETICCGCCAKEVAMLKLLARRYGVLLMVDGKDKGGYNLLRVERSRLDHRWFTRSTVENDEWVVYRYSVRNWRI